MKLLAILSAVSLSAPLVLVDADVLEPSIQNEVDHALDRVPTNCLAWVDYPLEFRTFCATNDFFGTNGLSHTEMAIKLISAQKAEGVWTFGTNDVTAVAVEILKGL